jgi:hypothetical protein
MVLLGILILLFLLAAPVGVAVSIRRVVGEAGERLAIRARRGGAPRPRTRRTA